MKGNSFLKIIFLVFAVFFLVSCSGGDDGDVVGTGGEPEVSGTAAEGAPCRNKTVTLKDARGKKKTTLSSEQGKFKFKVGGLTPPFILHVNTDDGRSFYSIAANPDMADGAKNNVNIHQLSDVIARNWFGSKGRNIESEFEGDEEISNPPLADEINALFDAIENLLVAAFQEFSISDGFNFISDEFEANRTGFDRMLDHTLIRIKEGFVTIKLKDPNSHYHAVIILNFNLSDDLSADDNENPEPPENLIAYAPNSTSAVLVWNPAEDNIGVAGYKIFRDNQEIGSTAYPVFSDTNLTTNVEVCYTVRAFDGSGNQSEHTDPPVCATPIDPPDTVAPAAIQDLSATAISASEINLAWTSSTEDDLVGYDIFRRYADTASIEIATILRSSNETESYEDFNLKAETEYCYKVVPFDTAGNRTLDNVVEECATTPATPVKPTDPIAPINNSVNLLNNDEFATDSLTVTISFSATDSFGVAAYCVMENNTGITPANPAANDSCWIDIPSTSAFNDEVQYSFTGNYEFNDELWAYVWFKDTSDNISAIASDSITYVESIDVVAPSNNAGSNFINNGAVSTTTTAVSLALSATDTVGVTGYCVQENNTGNVPNSPELNNACWAPVPAAINYSDTVNYNFTEQYAFNDELWAYVWFRDETGNISNAANDSITYVETIPVDTIPPVNNSGNNFIDSGAATTSSTTVTLSLAATDNINIASFCVLENNTGVTPNTPLPNDACWSNMIASANFVEDVQYTFSGAYAVNDNLYAYVWFKDTADNISAVASDSITYIDTTAPINTSVDFIDGGALSTSSNAVTISLSADDNVGVVGYCIMENDTGTTPANPAANDSCWISVASAPQLNSDVPYTFGTYPANTRVYAYLWFRDAAGLISAIASDDIVINSDPLSVDVSVLSDPVVPTGRAFYAITISNISSAPVTEVAVSYLVPAGIQFAQAGDAEPDTNCANNSFCDTGEEASWSFSRILPGASETIHINALVLDGQVDGTLITASIAVSAMGLANPITIDKTVEVKNSPSAELTLSASKDPVMPGETYSLLIDLGNISAVPLSGTELRAFLPAGATVVDNGGGVETGSGEIVWDLSAIAIERGAALHREVEITAPQLAGTMSTDILKSSAQLTFDGGAEVDVIAEHAVTVLDTAPTPPQVLFDISVAQTPAVVGSRLLYTMTVSNVSFDPLTGVSVMYRVPAGIQFAQADDAEPDTNCANNSFCDEAEEALWSLPDIAVGASATISFNATVLAQPEGEGSLISSPIRVMANELADTISLLHTVPVDSTNSAQLAISASKDPVMPGENYRLLLDLGNISDVPLTGTELRVFLPEGVTVVDNGGGDETDIGEIFWDLSTIAIDVGLTGHFEVEVTAPQLAGTVSTDILKARAQLTFDGGAEVDVIAEHAVTVLNTAPSPQPPLSFTVETTYDSINAPNLISYTLTVRNLTSSTISNVDVVYRVPAGIQFGQASNADPVTNCANDSFCDEGEEAWWTFDSIGTVPPDDQRTITISATILASPVVGTFISVPIVVTADVLNDTISILNTVPIADSFMP